jgi:glycosyltransferase involved in cell wall biosynthesis
MLSVSMIVKNESKHIRKCLESILPAADEIVIADTGSTDNTLEIISEFNVRLFHYKWENDFSAARNFSLKHCTGDWILYIDADEELCSNSVEEIRRITAGNETSAYYCTIENLNEITGNPSIMEYPRLFPNRKNILFCGKVHEQIEPSIRQSGIPLKYSGVKLIHKGYNIPKDQLKLKAERNLEILLTEFNKSPSAYYAYHLGQTYGTLDDKEAAVMYFAEALKLGRLYPEYKSIANRYIAVYNIENMNHAAAVKYADAAVKEYEMQPLSLISASKINLRVKNYKRAGELIKKAYEVNARLLKGEVKSMHSEFLKAEALIAEGIQTGLQSGDKELIRYFSGKLKNNNAEMTRSYIEDFLNCREITNTEEFLGHLDSDLLEIFIPLSVSFPLPVKTQLLIKIFMKFSDSKIVMTALGKALYENGLYNDSAEILESAFKKEPDAAVLFSLVSSCLMSERVERIKELIDYAEKNFVKDKFVIKRVMIMKQKLSSQGI